MSAFLRAAGAGAPTAVGAGRAALTLVCLLLSTAGALAEDPAEMAEYQNGLLPANTYSALAGMGAVNLYNDGFTLAVPLISLPGRAGHDLNLTLSYNSKQIARFDHWNGFQWEKAADWFYKGPTFGRWILNVWPSLEADGSYYYFTTPDGGVHKLAWDSGAGGYVSDDGTSIRYASNKVSFLDGSYFDFSEFSSGLKVHHVDRNGNRVTYEFENNYGTRAQMTEMTLPTGATLALGYSQPLTCMDGAVARSLSSAAVDPIGGGSFTTEWSYAADACCNVTQTYEDRADGSGKMVEWSTSGTFTHLRSKEHLYDTDGYTELQEVQTYWSQYANGVGTGTVKIKDVPSGTWTQMIR